MHVITKRRLQDFWDREPKARVSMTAWFNIVRRSNWSSPADVKAAFWSSVDFIADNRIIFDIGGNKYRIIVHVAYQFGKVLVKFVGTHKDYDRIKAETVT